MAEGGLLSSIGSAGRTASLVVTGEKLGKHAAADIRSGAVEVGDPVYHRPIQASPTLEKTAIPPVSSEVNPEKNSLQAIDNP
jgi:hypothetical protein